MKIVIHRGAKQIGGVVVELSSDKNRVFIDIGDDLPGVEALPFEGIEGLTCGDTTGSALFLTHYHGDHIGRLASVQPDIPVYIGETAKQILLNLAKRVKRDSLAQFEKIRTFSPAEVITVGDITIRPLMVDHSAFDAYMFVVDSEGKRILHTGDFRTHGFRGGKTGKMLSVYAKGIDYILAEGTMLSRTDETVMTESELKQKAMELMQENKNVFVLCSSTNIDRIAAFYHASRAAGRVFLCDRYQRDQLETVSALHSDKSSLYNFKKIYSVERIETVPPKLLSLMDNVGFCMLIRKGAKYKPYLERNEDKLIIYSMWSGYLRGNNADPMLVDFLAPYSVVELHTSGHATAGALKEIYDIVKPKKGLIPMHSEKPEVFKSIVGEENVILLDDGEVLNG